MLPSNNQLERWQRRARDLCRYERLHPEGTVRLTRVVVLLSSLTNGFINQPCPSTSHQFCLKPPRGSRGHDIPSFVQVSTDRFLPDGWQHARRGPWWTWIYPLEPLGSSKNWDNFWAQFWGMAGYRMYGPEFLEPLYVCHMVMAQKYGVPVDGASNGPTHLMILSLQTAQTRPSEQFGVNAML